MAAAAVRRYFFEKRKANDLVKLCETMTEKNGSGPKVASAFIAWNFRRLHNHHRTIDFLSLFPSD
jgi:hypothetical protein